ncbi:hypothetical protein C7S17_0365 [Burkholderia thailandensis]|nr:hypothetical protein [Burkholderia thailandensis]
MAHALLSAMRKIGDNRRFEKYPGRVRTPGCRAARTRLPT